MRLDEIATKPPPAEQPGDPRLHRLPQNCFRNSLASFGFIITEAEVSSHLRLRFRIALA